MPLPLLNMVAIAASGVVGIIILVLLFGWAISVQRRQTRQRKAIYAQIPKHTLVKMTRAERKTYAFVGSFLVLCMFFLFNMTLGKPGETPFLVQQIFVALMLLLLSGFTVFYFYTAWKGVVPFWHLPMSAKLDRYREVMKRSQK